MYVCIAVLVKMCCVLLQLMDISVFCILFCTLELTQWKLFKSPGYYYCYNSERYSTVVQDYYYEVKIVKCVGLQIIDMRTRYLNSALCVFHRLLLRFVLVVVVVFVVVAPTTSQQNKVLVLLILVLVD